MRSLCIWLVALCLCLALPQAAFAGEHIVRDVLASGGGAASSADHLLLYTIGQPVIDLTTAVDYTHEQGFWYLPWFLVTGAETPRAFVCRLDQNYPNPFNPMTMIRFSLTRPSRVTLRIYDVAGRIVRTVVDERVEAGEHSLPFEARDLASGVYFYRLKTAEFEKTKKMVLLR